MIKELRPYNAKTWLPEFLQSKTYQQLQSKYHHVVASHRDMTLLRAAWHDTVYEAGRKFCEDYSILDAVPYYYIDFLMQQNPQVIVDLGCGLNVFKKAWPNIVGIDADASCPYDIFDHFDEEFATGHQGLCNALISINAIHFAPIDTIAQRLLWVAGLVQPGGRAFVSFNVETWLMYTPRTRLETLFGIKLDLDQVLEYINQQIVSTGLALIVNDWPVLRVPDDGTIRDDLNGNIRLVFDCD